MCSTGQGKKVLTQTFQMLNLAGSRWHRTEQAAARGQACNSAEHLWAVPGHREPHVVSRSSRQKVRAVISGLLISPACAVIYEFGQGFSLFPWEELLSGVCTLHVAATALWQHKNTPRVAGGSE